MDIVLRKTEELIPYERNQKKHDAKQIANVANSIKRFGWQQPIVVDSKDVVIIGHCRLLAAKKLGLSEVPVTVADNLTEDEVRELRIADNKTNESAWDFNALKIDMPELKFEGFDFGDFNFLKSNKDNFDDIEDFFTPAPVQNIEEPPKYDSEEKQSIYEQSSDIVFNNEPRKIQCPHCGQWIQV